MRKRLTITLLVVLALALVAAATLVGVRWWRAEHRTELEQAASYAPSDAERLSWTDWAAVRAREGAHLNVTSSPADVRRFLDKGYDADLTSASALVESAPALQEDFGFSPGTADWELFSQSQQGAVVIIRMPDDTDFRDLGDRLADVGYSRPATEGGVWLGGDGLLPRIAADLTPELQYVALDPDDHLVLTSDTADYLAQTVENLGAHELPEAMRDVVAASGDPLSAAIYDGTYTCSALAMSHADPADEREGEQLVREAGEISPVTGFAMSVQPGGHVRVVMAFENDEEARTNADTRAALATGPAPGQGGDFADRFSLASTTAKGQLVTLDLVPKRGTYVFSDLSTGPLLFATC